jgi:16S rRNA G966 N2-methylase RsmD
MFVTTAGRTNEEMIEQAKKVANDLGCLYVPRKKKTVKQLMGRLNDSCIVVGKERIELHPLLGKAPFFFHPSSATFRMIRLLRGEKDPLIEASQLTNGMTFLDCTMGMGSDSIVASLIVGRTGNVTALEGNKYIAYIVQNGLKRWTFDHQEMDEAMRRVHVINERYESFLKKQRDNSFDVVYFDPMFEQTIDESSGLSGLKRLAIYDDITENMIEEALRVAKNRVVLKDYHRSSRFKRFGFHVYRRPSASFHYGVLTKSERY